MLTKMLLAVYREMVFSPSMFIKVKCSDIVIDAKHHSYVAPLGLYLYPPPQPR
uniref:Uncharacterized protein n=1 Tax=Anguilla anguilla TaxID=7936 RepID=A0A0E9Q6J6_ANGAN